jgi:hypothetical protein
MHGARICTDSEPVGKWVGDSGCVAARVMHRSPEAASMGGEVEGWA